MNCFDLEIHRHIFQWWVSPSATAYTYFYLSFIVLVFASGEGDCRGRRRTGGGGGPRLRGWGGRLVGWVEECGERKGDRKE